MKTVAGCGRNLRIEMGMEISVIEAPYLKSIVFIGFYQGG
jgi:hypothetical protein